MTTTPTEGSAPVFTKDQSIEFLDKYISIDKPGLRRFYADRTALDTPAANGMEMATALWDNGAGCTVEIARDMQILILYDLVMLIDDSASMFFDEPNNERIETLEKTLNEIAKIYTHVRSNGIISVRFLNDNRGKANVVPKWVNRIVTQHAWRGVTRIGTELEKKILDCFVYEKVDGQPRKLKNLQKPLLIMVITDGTIEGEAETTLQTAIFNCVNHLKMSEADGGFGDDGADTVAFHFSRVGRDPVAAQFLQKLDDDPIIGSYVDCLPVNEQSCLDNIINGDRLVKWNGLAKLLLGAIHPLWDDYNGSLTPLDAVQLAEGKERILSQIADDDCDSYT